MQVDTNQIQGIVLGSYQGFPFVRHLIFPGGDSARLRAFVAPLLPMILYGTDQPPAASGWVLNLSFAAGALEKLVPPALFAKLETTYREGPDGLALGDVGTSAPATWWEGQGPGFTAAASCFVHIHATSPAEIEAGTKRVLEAARDAGLDELFPRAAGGRLDGRFLEPGPNGGVRLHFGYVDGLSNGKIAWADPPSGETPVNFRAAVIGYNENDFPSAPATGPAADMFRDSSYLVFRWVYQDSAAFERFLTAQGPALYPDLEPERARELLAAKMMGRWRDGTPLVLSPDREEPSLGGEDFKFGGDPAGAICPVSAHIRVMNPRDQPLSGMAVVGGVPRIVRRGMSYGPRLDGEVDDGVDRGVYGMFACASIRVQFMKLVAWGLRNDFSKAFPAHGRDQDALIGNRAAPGATRLFKIPGAAGDGTCRSLPDFLRTKGTQYLMLPSRSTMAKLFPARPPSAGG